MIPLHALLFGSQLLLTVADQVPQFDVTPTCRGATTDGMGTVDSCKKQESEARDQLAKNWGKYSAADKTMCGGETTQFAPSYVELLTCLEMYQFAHQLRDGDSKMSPDGETTGNAAGKE